MQSRPVRVRRERRGRQLGQGLAQRARYLHLRQPDPLADLILRQIACEPQLDDPALDGATTSSSAVIGEPSDELELAIDAHQLEQPLDLDRAAYHQQSAAGLAYAATRRQEQRRTAGIQEVERPQIEHDARSLARGGTQLRVELGDAGDVQLSGHRDGRRRPGAGTPVRERHWELSRVPARRLNLRSGHVAPPWSLSSEATRSHVGAALLQRSDEPRLYALHESEYPFACKSHRASNRVQASTALW